MRKNKKKFPIAAKNILVWLYKNTTIREILIGLEGIPVCDREEENSGFTCQKFSILSSTENIVGNFKSQVSNEQLY
jgi:hypothetical protein